MRIHLDYRNTMYGRMKRPKLRFQRRQRRTRSHGTKGRVKTEPSAELEITDGGEKRKKVGVIEWIFVSRYVGSTLLIGITDLNATKIMQLLFLPLFVYQ